MELIPLKLFGGLTAADLWPTNNIVLLTWGLVMFAPYWEWTPALTLIAPICNSLVYVGTVGSLLLWPQPDAAPVDFTTLEGVVTMFQDPTGVFGGWVHYVVFDALVGRMILLDSLARGNNSWQIHLLIMIPCLFFTMMLGPSGFLMYMILRNFLPSNKNAAGEKTKIL